MIDRKALWFSIIVIAAMVGGAFWCLSLLSDWHRIALDGPGGKRTLNSLFLFVHPLGMTVATVAMYGRKWFASGSENDVQPWRHHGAKFLIGFGVLVGLMQAFMISRALGYGMGTDPRIISRTAFVATGILIMAGGNAMPKLPWLAGRFRALHLDPWQQNRHLRFSGKLMVAMGLYLALIGIGLPWMQLLPPALRLPLLLVPCPLIVAASLWHRAKLKREPSPQ